MEKFGDISPKHTPPEAGDKRPGIEKGATRESKAATADRLAGHATQRLADQVTDKLKKS